MAILETKTLVEEGIANAYASAGDKGATIPEQKNIKNLAETIASIQSGGGDELSKILIERSATSLDLSGTKATRIGDYAFYYYNDTYVGNGLVSVTLADTIDEIGKYAFYYCSQLSYVDFKNGITKIGDYAFNHCDSLDNITLPSSLKIIGPYSFEYCKLSNIVINEGVSSIQQRAFRYSGLTTITLPSTVTVMSQEILYGCNSLTKIVVKGDGITFQSGAFSNNPNLKEVIFEKNVASINSRAMQNNTSCLKYDFTNCTKVTPITSSLFLNINENCKIYVPDSLYDTWITASNWVTYATYIDKASNMP